MRIAIYNHSIADDREVNWKQKILPDKQHM